MRGYNRISPDRNARPTHARHDLCANIPKLSNLLQISACDQVV
jgi:hypothetical protein